MSCLRLLTIMALIVIGNCSIPHATVQRLYDNITSGYDPRIPPIHDQNLTIRVDVQAEPFSVLELSTSDQRLAMLMLTTVIWSDQFLVWNATDYDGIDKLVFKVGELWHPRITIAVSYSEDKAFFGDDKDVVQVQSSGQVTWFGSSTVSVRCVVNIAFYPFDIQKCDMFLYPSYTLFGVIDIHPISLHGMTEENTEWHLLDIKMATSEGKPGFNQHYLFRRRAEFIVYTTIVPLILLAVLNACVVLVPVSSGEKGSIAVTLFLSYCVYLTSIGETLPPNSEKTSYLLLYMTIVQIFSALTMLYSVVETRMYIHGTKITYACFHYPRKKRNGDNGVKTHDDDISKQAESDEQADPVGTCNEEALDVYRKLDVLVFVVNLTLNITVVVVFTILTIKNIQHAMQ